MDFCQGSDGSTFQSSALSSGGQDPTTINWGARRLNLSPADVQQTIYEGRLTGTGIWDIDGNKALHMNN